MKKKDLKAMLGALIVIVSIGALAYVHTYIKNDIGNPQENEE